MPDDDFHKIHPDEFELAFVEAAATYVGWLIAREGQGPSWSESRNEAFRRAAEKAFNAGYELGLKGWQP